MISEEDTNYLLGKLKSVSKKKSVKELELITVRSRVIEQTEELAKVNEEIQILQLELQVQEENINGAQKQLSVIELCKACDNTKVGAHLNSIDSFTRGYHELFEKEREAIERQCEEQRRKEADHLEKIKIQQREIMRHNEKQNQEVMIIEAECETIERECVVLRKRNAAILLRLRRTLIEKKDARRNFNENK